MTTRSAPERLDEAVDSLLAGERPLVDAELRPLVDVAGVVAGTLRPLPAGRRFEAELGQRLAARAAGRRPLDLVTPGRLLAAGAISSAAVAVTVTALRRSSRRHGNRPQRLLQR